MREILINGLRSYYTGVIARARANVEVYLTNAVGVGEHSDISETIQKEISIITDAEDELNTLESFAKPAKTPMAPAKTPMSREFR